MTPESPPSDREQLEARLTALLLGELPADEAAALEQTLAQDAELARLRAELEQAIGLVRETAASSQSDGFLTPLPELSAERREKLRQAFKVIRPREFGLSRKPRRFWREWAAVAAMVVGLHLALFVVFRRMFSPEVQLASHANFLTQLEPLKAATVGEERTPGRYAFAAKPQKSPNVPPPAASPAPSSAWNFHSPPPAPSAPVVLPQADVAPPALPDIPPAAGAISYARILPPAPSAPAAVVPETRVENRAASLRTSARFANIALPTPVVPAAPAVGGFGFDTDGDGAARPAGGADMAVLAGDTGVTPAPAGKPPAKPTGVSALFYQNRATAFDLAEAPAKRTGASGGGRPTVIGVTEPEQGRSDSSRGFQPTVPGGAPAQSDEARRLGQRGQVAGTQPGDVGGPGVPLGTNYSVVMYNYDPVVSDPARAIAGGVAFGYPVSDSKSSFGANDFFAQRPDGGTGTPVNRFGEARGPQPVIPGGAARSGQMGGESQGRGEGGFGGGLSFGRPSVGDKVAAMDDFSGPRDAKPAPVIEKGLAEQTAAQTKETITGKERVMVTNSIASANTEGFGRAEWFADGTFGDSVHLKKPRDDANPTPEFAGWNDTGVGMLSDGTKGAVTSPAPANGPAKGEGRATGRTTDNFGPVTLGSAVAQVEPVIPRPPADSTPTTRDRFRAVADAFVTAGAAPIQPAEVTGKPASDKGGSVSQADAKPNSVFEARTDGLGQAKSDPHDTSFVADFGPNGRAVVDAAMKQIETMEVFDTMKQALKSGDAGGVSAGGQGQVSQNFGITSLGGVNQGIATESFGGIPQVKDIPLVGLLTAGAGNFWDASIAPAPPKYVNGTLNEWSEAKSQSGQGNPGQAAANTWRYNTNATDLGTFARWAAEPAGATVVRWEHVEQPGPTDGRMVVDGLSRAKDALASLNQITAAKVPASPEDSPQSVEGKGKEIPVFVATNSFPATDLQLDPGARGALGGAPVAEDRFSTAFASRLSIAGNGANGAGLLVDGKPPTLGSAAVVRGLVTDFDKTGKEGLAEGAKPASGPATGVGGVYSANAVGYVNKSVADPLLDQTQPKTDPALDEALRRQERTHAARRFIEQGDAVLQNNQIAQAAQRYDTALQALDTVGNGADGEKQQAIQGVANTRLHLADQSMRNADPMQAKVQIDRVLAVDPGNAKALALKKENDVMYDRMATLSPDAATQAQLPKISNAESQAAVLAQNSKFYYEHGQLANSLTNTIQALKLDPENPMALYYRNLISGRQAQRSAAKHNLQDQVAMLEVEQGWIHSDTRDRLPIPNPEANTNRVYTSSSRQTIFRNMRNLVLREFTADGLPLSEVVRQLEEEVRKVDRDGRGINFNLSASAEPPTAAVPSSGADAAGAPIPGAGQGLADLGGVSVKLRLRNVTVEDALNAITLMADKRIKYSVEDSGINFSFRNAETTPLHTRLFRVDTNTFWQGLQNVVAFDFGGNLGSTGQGGGGGFGGGGGNRGGGGFGGGGQGAAGGRQTQQGIGPVGQGGGIGFLSEVTNTTQLIPTLKAYFSAAGVDFTTPSGTNGPQKALFFNDRLGTLLVRGTTQDLDLVERAVQMLNMAPAAAEGELSKKKSNIVLPEISADSTSERLTPGNPLMVSGKVSDASAQPAESGKSVSDLARLSDEAKKLEHEAELVRAKRTPAPSAPVPQPEVTVTANPFSTFSLNVSDVSFQLAAASLEKGALPDPATIRSEEFLNAFDYHDPEPAGNAPIAFAWERARDPFAHDREFLRFSVKTAASGRQPGRPLNLVLLLDNSGSMERADRVRIRQECLRVLAGQLQPADRVSVVSFARTPRLWVDGLAGGQAGELAERVGSLTPEGGTNLEDALNLAYRTALRHYLPNGVNRVVLLTDGAANLGDVEPDSLKKRVEANRAQGVALDCFGIGWEGYNDDLLEVLSRNGDGRYGFVNTPEAAAANFAGQLAGALRVAAADVKVQVEFNPRRVTSYRQIGYAKHQLTKEQFRDNTVDAAEIGAAEAGNGLYVVQVNPRGEGPLATVRVRFKVPGTSDYREHEWTVPYDGPAKPLELAGPSMRLAATATAFSEWLVASPYAGEVTPDKLLSFLSGVPETCVADPRPKKLETMIRQAKSAAGK